MLPEHIVRPAAVQISSPRGVRLAARQWTAAVHSSSAVGLPAGAREALVSDTLQDEHGQPVDVFRKFTLEPAKLDTLYGNLRGIMHTARVTSPPPGNTPSPPWEGFEEVEVPLSDGLKPHARLGAPRPADEIPGSYVVITHGMFGSLEGVSMENHVQALRRAGHHVLAIELRGHGQTNERNRTIPITFGLRETSDLLSAARWLKREHHAKRVGLVSFSMTGFESLLAAWLDAAPLDPRDAGRPILRIAQKPNAEPSFNGGMFIVSTPVAFQTLSPVFAKRWKKLMNPVKATFQHQAEARLREFGDPPAWNLWDFVTAELRRDGWTRAYPSDAEMRSDMEWYLDMREDNWSAGVRRMEAVRTPVLVLSAANDPLATAQDVAKLFSRVNNPNIGVILLNRGGHMGFSALSAAYYYSLMTAFFDPATAPRGIAP